MYSSIQKVVKGDVIVERVAGKKRMISVTKVEFNACSSRGVHVNRNSCYDFNAMVDLVPGEATLKDLEEEMTALGDLEEDFPTVNDIRQAGIDSIEAWAERLVKH